MKSSNDDTPIDGQCRGKNKQCQDICIVTTIWMESWGYAPITITRLWILMNLVLLRDSKWNGYVFAYFLYHFFVSPFLGLRLVHFWRCNSNRATLCSQAAMGSSHGWQLRPRSFVKCIHVGCLVAQHAAGMSFWLDLRHCIGREPFGHRTKVPWIW